LFQKMWQTEPFLELNLIFSHDFLLCFATGSVCSTWWLNS
jgi:hypothetical protein